jgi:hypothetical protein
VWQSCSGVFFESSAYPVNVITCCKVGDFNYQQLTSHSSRTKNSWLFAPSSLSLANNFLPLSEALEVMAYIKSVKKIIKVLIILLASLILLLFIGLVYDDFKTQCSANKKLKNAIDKHVLYKTVDSYRALDGYCTAATFCIINHYCPTSYSISYSDHTSECATAEIEYFRGVFINFSSCD